MWMPKRGGNNKRERERRERCIHQIRSDGVKLDTQRRKKKIMRNVS